MSNICSTGDMYLGCQKANLTQQQYFLQCVPMNLCNASCLNIRLRCCVMGTTRVRRMSFLYFTDVNVPPITTSGDLKTMGNGTLDHDESNNVPVTFKKSSFCVTFIFMPVTLCLLSEWRRVNLNLSRKSIRLRYCQCISLDSDEKTEQDVLAYIQSCIHGNARLTQTTQQHCFQMDPVVVLPWYFYCSWNCCTEPIE